MREALKGGLRGELRGVGSKLVVTRGSPGGAVQERVSGGRRTCERQRAQGPTPSGPGGRDQGGPRPRQAKPLETRPPEIRPPAAVEKTPGFASPSLACAAPGCHGLGPTQTTLTTEVRSCTVLGSVSAISPVPSLAVISQTVTNTSVCQSRRPQRLLLATTDNRRATAGCYGNCSWCHALARPAVSRVRLKRGPAPPLPSAPSPSPPPSSP